jgi:hypothetical protein
MLYMLLGESVTEAGAVLARFDPVAFRVESVPLALPPYDGGVSMAAGADGLFLAAVEGKAGRWSLAWKKVEEASWREHPEVTVQGVTAASFARMR